MKFTYQWVFILYWWEDLYVQIKKHKQICKDCQRWDKTMHNDIIFLIYMSILFKKVSVNVIKMLRCQNKKYIVVTQKNLSDWIEAKVLTQTIFMIVAKFL